MVDSAQVVPSLLVATEKHWKWEEGDWPDMEAILKCPEEDLIDHPWYKVGRTTGAPSDATLVEVTQGKLSYLLTRRSVAQAKPKLQSC